MIYPADTHPGTTVPHRTVYRLCVEGQFDELAFDYVDNLTLALTFTPTERAFTTLTCELTNQEALVGLINLLHDFGLRLVVVERLGAESFHRQLAESHR